MKILYGVQATGNGHITRARAISEKFREAGVEVDYLFSGRDRKKFFDMECFGNWQCHAGMTFVHKGGRVQPAQTFLHNKAVRLYRDVRNLDIDRYDLVITDFEPISAWAAKLKRKTAIGVGHQYAFHSRIPLRGDSAATRLVMRHFAPVNIPLGLHWHHFGQPILPPIAQTHSPSESCPDPRKIVVYLGFEAPDQVIRLLEPFEDYLFFYYGDFAAAENRGNIQLRPLSREGFQRDLATCNGVISNAGFELASEALHLGKKLLVKPLHGQMEQLSNAAALEQLQLGMSMARLDAGVVRTWLDTWPSRQVIYPDVAGGIVQWILNGDWTNPGRLVADLWAQVISPHNPHFADFPLRTTSLFH